MYRERLENVQIKCRRRTCPRGRRRPFERCRRWRRVCPPNSRDSDRCARECRMPSPSRRTVPSAQCENTNEVNCLVRTTKKREEAEVVYAIAVVGDELQETVRVGGRLHFQVELPGLRGLLVHYVCTRTKRVQVVKRQNESVKLKAAMKTEEAVAYSSARATR